MRLFIAALIPEDTKKEIYNLISLLKDDNDGGKWERPEKLHITLKFLGNVDNDRYKKLKDDLKANILDITLFKLSIEELSAFPNFKRPRVIVLKIKESSYIKELQSRVEKVCVDNGFSSEQRKFIPHITIGRVKSGFKHKKDSNNYRFDEFYVNKIAIVKSEIDSKGSNYKNLDVFDLQ